MKLILLPLALVFLVFSSCKKSKDDPEPSSDPIYRLTKVFSHGIDDSTSYSYHYNSDNTLKTIYVRDSVRNELKTISLSYNPNGFVNYCSQTVGSPNDYAYSFEYNENNLVKTKKYYVDPLGANELSQTVNYFYNSTNDLLYCIVENNNGINRDSILFEGYISNRPSIKKLYTKTIGEYSLKKKTHYTYDGRMNRIKVEETNYGGDTTVFYTVQTRNFKILSGQQQSALNNISNSEFTYLYNDNPSKLTKDVDRDALSSIVYGGSCGDFSKMSSVVVSENEFGYILKEKSTVDNYNCGSFIKSRTFDSYYTYEQL